MSPEPGNLLTYLFGVSTLPFVKIVQKANFYFYPEMSQKSSGFGKPVA